MARIERIGDVLVLDLGDGENRFNAGSLDEIEACLEEVEAAAPCALVTISPLPPLVPMVSVPAKSGLVPTPD